jgi:translation initiation factor eIF-2B subunit epsilon
MADRSRTSSFMSTASDEDSAGDHAKHFHHEAANSIFDSLQKGDETANIQLELNALRLGTNASEHQVRRAVAQAFMKRISQLIESGSPAAKAVSDTLGKHKTLLERTMFDGDKDNKPDQVDFLLLLQQDAVNRKDGDTTLLHMIKALVELEVIEAEGVEQWWNDGKSCESEQMKHVREKTKKLVEFLVDDSDDEESGEEESDDD